MLIPLFVKKNEFRGSFLLVISSHDGKNYFKNRSKYTKIREKKTIFAASKKVTSIYT